VNRAQPDMGADFTDADLVFNAKRAKHGLQPAQRDALLASQGGRCAICRTNNPGSTPWGIDHDHRHHPGPQGCPFCIRGILDQDCNNMLLRAHDDPAILRAGADYLERAERRRRW
jgi:hypothetical protein